jgi:hypothetical protein
MQVNTQPALTLRTFVSTVPCVLCCAGAVLWLYFPTTAQRYDESQARTHQPPVRSLRRAKTVAPSRQLTS